MENAWRGFDGRRKNRVVLYLTFSRFWLYLGTSTWDKFDLLMGSFMVLLPNLS